MKISQIQENLTPASTPSVKTIAPKFGRSDEMLESDCGTTGASSIATVSAPMGKMQKRGKGSMFQGIQTSEKFANSRKAGIKESYYNHDDNRTGFSKPVRQDDERNPEFDDKMRKITGMIFYNVDDTELAQQLGLKQTRTGKWFLRTGNRNAQQAADGAFGQGKIWYPKNESMEEGQQWPDTSTSLASRKPVAAFNNQGVKAGRPGGMTVATRVEPTITSTKVQRKDDRPIPSFLQKEVQEASFDYTTKDLGNDYAGFASNHSMKHKFLARIKPEKQQLYKDKINNTHEWDDLFALFNVAKQRGDIIEQGVAEGHADQQRKIFKKNGKPVGEVGIDRESSPGNGQWYMKCYAYDIDNSGYDSYEEAVEELKHCLKQGVAEGYNPEYDDEAGMADNNLETLKRTVDGIDEVISAGDNLPEWCQEKIAISKSMLVTVWDYMRSEQEKNPEELDENLKQWFKEKWVRFGPDGKIRGDCARGDDSEGKPKCLPQSKAHALGKKGRASAGARKRREDPNPERSGKAINVNTKKKSNEGVAEAELDEACWKGYHKEGNKKMFGKQYPNCVKNANEEVEHDKCPECGGKMVSEDMMNEVKDACYSKVKSRYKVWPSAYASGALVKCRKVGAANWGNGGKKNESIAEAELSEEQILAKELKKQLDMFKKGADKDISGKAKDKAISSKAQDKEIVAKEDCWSGYKQVGMKKKGSKSVPNCVPKEGVAEGFQLDEGAIETITALVKKIPGIGKYYQMAQQYKPQLIEILKTSKSGKEVKQKMEQLAAGQSATVAESGMMKQLGGLAVGGGSILSTMWMNAMGMIDGVLARAAAGEVGGAVASGSILGLIPVTLMLFAAMLMFKGSNQSSDEKAQAFQAQRRSQGVAEGSEPEYMTDKNGKTVPVKPKKDGYQIRAEKKKATQNKEQGVAEGEWSNKYKSSINCSNPKGFSQKAHCAGKKK